MIQRYEMRYSNKIDWFTMSLLSRVIEGDDTQLQQLTFISVLAFLCQEAFLVIRSGTEKLAIVGCNG